MNRWAIAGLSLVSAILLMALSWLITSQPGTVASPVPAVPQNGPNGEWTLVESPLDGTSTLKSVAMVSADEGWAVGDKGLHYISGTWNIEPSLGWGSTVAMGSPSEGWAAGGYWICNPFHGSKCALIQHYSNGIWNTPIRLNAGRVTSISMISADESWAVTDGDYGSPGMILHYSNGSWDGGLGSSSRPLRAISMIPSGEGWAVGSDYWQQNNVFYHRTNGIWETVSISTTSTINSVATVSADEAWAVGDWGTILHYSGGSWQQVSSPTSQFLNSVAMVSATEGWAVGNYGTILYYGDGGWQSVSSSTTQYQHLYSVAVVSPQDAWAVGGVILHFRGPELQSSPNEITVMMRPDDDDVLTRTVQVANVGFGSLNWTASVTPSSWLGLSPVTGTLSSGLSTTVTLIIAKTGLSLGWNTIPVVIDSNVGDEAITVRAYYGDVTRLRFPFIMNGATASP